MSFFDDFSVARAQPGKGGFTLIDNLQYSKMELFLFVHVVVTSCPVDRRFLLHGLGHDLRDILHLHPVLGLFVLDAVLKHGHAVGAGDGDG